MQPSLKEDDNLCVSLQKHSMFVFILVSFNSTWTRVKRATQQQLDLLPASVHSERWMRQQVV